MNSFTLNSVARPVHFHSLGLRHDIWLQVFVAVVCSAVLEEQPCKNGVVITALCSCLRDKLMWWMTRPRLACVFRTVAVRDFGIMKLAGTSNSALTPNDGNRDKHRNVGCWILLTQLVAQKITAWQNVACVLYLSLALTFRNLCLS